MKIKTKDGKTLQYLGYPDEFESDECKLEGYERESKFGTAVDIKTSSLKLHKGVYFVHDDNRFVFYDGKKFVEISDHGLLLLEKFLELFFDSAYTIVRQIRKEKERILVDKIKHRLDYIFPDADKHPLPIIAEMLYQHLDFDPEYTVFPTEVKAKLFVEKIKSLGNSKVKNVSTTICGAKIEYVDGSMTCVGFGGYMVGFFCHMNPSGVIEIFRGE